MGRAHASVSLPTTLRGRIVLSLRAHLLISGGLFAAITLYIAAGGALRASGLIKPPDALKVPMLAILLLLVFAFAMSLIPVMVKLVLGAQKAIGNQDVPAVKAVLNGETVIVWTLWLLMGGGMLVAVPAAIADGAFGPEGKQAIGRFLPAGKSLGVLAAKPGMTVDELVRGSTLKLQILPDAPVISGSGASFDFRIPGSNVVFSGCRYYFLSTFIDDRRRIESMSIGLSAAKVGRAELDAAEADVRRRLAADGWLAGHEVYRDERDRQLHGGRTEGLEGRAWMKDGVILTLEDRRMDDPAAGEDPATAGEWIQTLALGLADTYPGRERMVFAPARS